MPESMPQRQKLTAFPSLRPDAVTPRQAAQAGMPRSRWSRAQRVRLEIKSWLYDEEAGLEAALDRLAQDLGVELTEDGDNRA